MKKLFLSIFILISFSAFGSVEMSVTKDYAKKTSNGERINTDKVNVALIRDTDIFNNNIWYIAEIGYRIKKANSKGAFIPEIGIRYYPISILPIFINSTAGIELETHGHLMTKLGLGYKFDDIITSVYATASADKRISTGIDMGYKL